MSHAVDPGQLAEVAAPYGETPFLLYATERGSARANHVRAVPQPGSAEVLITGFGRGVLNAIERDAMLSLLWPSPTEGELSLIADGTGEVTDEHNLVLTVTSAVLHRPAPSGGGSATC